MKFKTRIKEVNGRYVFQYTYHRWIPLWNTLQFWSDKDCKWKDYILVSASRANNVRDVMNNMYKIKSWYAKENEVKKIYDKHVL